MSERRSFPPAPTRAHALLLCAHPYPDSFNHALAQAWTEGLESTGATVDRIDLNDLDFEIRLKVAYRDDQPLEPDLERVRDAVADAAHLAIAFPVWWGSTPAVLKGLIDRVFLPGWAATLDGKIKPGLKGRTGRLIMTMDAPTWYDRWVYRASARRQMNQATLQFCGIKPVQTSAFGMVSDSKAKKRAQMLEKARKAGVADGKRLTQAFASH